MKGPNAIGALLWGVVALSISVSSLVAGQPPTPATEPAGPLGDKPGEWRPEDAEAIQDIDLFTLEVPVVVTAARHEQKITTVPYAVSVITAEDIRWSGARSIPDALRLVPGVDVADLTYGSSGVSPRGIHGLLSNQLLVLVDGRQVYDSVFGGTLWGSWPFQLEDIERIEVLRGPGGVTWGSNAVQGVVNIITKDPADQRGLTVTGGGGSRGSHKEHAGYGWADDRLRLRVSGEYEASDGFRNGGSFLRRLEDDMKAGRSAVHAVYQANSNDTLTLSGGNAVVDGLYPPAPLAGFGVRRNPGSQASFLLGKWTRKIATDERVELTGYFNDFHGCAGERAIDFRYQQFALQLGHVLKPAADHTLTWGVDGRIDVLDTSNSDPFMLTEKFIGTGTVGLYLQDEWRFAPKWALSLGGRLDYECYGGFEPSARAALSYELSEGSILYGAVSRAFQMVSPGVRFLNIPLLNGLARATGDADMDAQTLVAYELGYRGRPLDRLDAGLNLFWNEYDDLGAFSPRLGPPGLIRQAYSNRAEASMYGMELDTKYALSKELTLLGNYTYQQMDWRSRLSMHDKDAISPPRHKFMLGARYSATDDLHLSAHLYYVDAVKAPYPSNPFTSRQVPPYFRLDLRAEHEFWNDRASVAVGVRNLLDRNHYEGGSLFINDAEVPRMVYAELRVTVK